MVKFVLVRHGQSQANEKGYFAGQLDSPATELGCYQAERTADYIAKHYAVDSIYSSDLQRAAVVARAVSDKTGVPVRYAVDLREINAGKWQGLTFERLSESFPNYQTWLNDIGNVTCDGGESVERLQSRIVAALRDIAQLCPNQTVVIVTHATPIRALQCYCTCADLSSMKEIPWVSNSSITEINYDNGAFQLGFVSYDKYLGNATSKFPANV